MKLNRLRNRAAGFTLIELLIVIAIIGILAAIAIPNLLNALQRGKQKRTMSDMRNLAIAIESYNVDNNQYPTATTCPTFPAADKSLDSGSFVLLKPTYIAQPPFQDGWQKPLHYGVEATTGQSYTIGSGGRDGAYTDPTVCGTTTDFNADIVYSNGTFIAYPDGPQH
ncbi:MAG: prepilin-type N-terminal cleavage/methylation domain-containing protein [Thermoanaerobaculia bacterium]